MQHLLRRCNIISRIAVLSDEILKSCQKCYILPHLPHILKVHFISLNCQGTLKPRYENSQKALWGFGGGGVALVESKQ